jgi:hypothetical protein
VLECLSCHCHCHGHHRRRVMMSNKQHTVHHHPMHYRQTNSQVRLRISLSVTFHQKYRIRLSISDHRQPSATIGMGGRQTAVRTLLKQIRLYVSFDKKVLQNLEFACLSSTSEWAWEDDRRPSAITGMGGRHTDEFADEFNELSVRQIITMYQMCSIRLSVGSSLMPRGIKTGYIGVVHSARAKCHLETNVVGG